MAAGAAAAACGLDTAATKPAMTSGTIAVIPTALNRRIGSFECDICDILAAGRMGRRRKPPLLAVRSRLTTTDTAVVKKMKALITGPPLCRPPNQIAAVDSLSLVGAN
jgi:hypothetical protein